jgi:hypothetical protein
MIPISRRDLLRAAALAAASLALPIHAAGTGRQGASLLVSRSGPPGDPLRGPNEERLREWVRAARGRGLADAGIPLGRSVAAVGELALGTPYEAYTLEAYLAAGGSPLETEPLTLSLDRFDCVTLVESCLAVARLARGPGTPSWEDFGREVERVRYRGGKREGYASRLHYFSEWISDNAARGLLRPVGAEAGAEPDIRPLRFMSTHRNSYPALADPRAYEQIQRMERALDGRARRVIPTDRIEEVADRIETGDVLAFATSIEGLDVTHSAMAYRDGRGVLRVLHAPLSGGVVEVSGRSLPEYVRNIRGSTGILVARPM